MFTKDSFKQHILNRIIINQRYEFKFIPTESYEGTVKISADPGGAIFNGTYGISEDRITDDVIICLSIPNADFLFLKDGRLEYKKFVISGAETFCHSMENEFHAVIGK